MFRLHIYICAFMCTHMCVPLVHRRVFTCAHFRVPTRQVFVFQKNTCLFSDEYACLSVFLRAHKCVCVFKCSTHVCVFPCAHVHVCTCVSLTCTHVCAFTCANMCVLIRQCSRVHIWVCVFLPCQFFSLRGRWGLGKPYPRIIPRAIPPSHTP